MLNDTIINGVGISNGRAIGKVLVLKGTFDDSNLIDPTILVVPKLEREIIINLKQNVIGIVALTGGIGSHGAGILRELGIPGVIGIASTALNDGELIELFGDDGKIHKLDTLDAFRNKNFSIIENNIEYSDHDCFRPDRPYQKLRFDILKDGWEESPSFLFGLSNCTLYQDEKGIIHVKGGPRIDDLVNLFIKYPDLFLYLSKMREYYIEKIKNKLKLNLSSCNCDDLHIVKGLFRNMMLEYKSLLKFIYLTQFVSEPIISAFKETLNDLIPDSTGSLKDFLHSEYIANSLKEKVYPGKTTTWTLPAGDPVIYNGRINWNIDHPYDIDLLRLVFKKSQKYGLHYLSKYISLRSITPLVYQMSEEHYFISSSIGSYLNHIISILSNTYLNENNDNRSAIYDLSFEVFEKNILVE